MSGPQHPPTGPEYIYSIASSNNDRVKELERRVELLGHIVSHLCELNGTTFNELMDYYEKLDRDNKDFAEKNKAHAS